MILIRPQTVTDAALVSSNVAEAVPAAWSSATTYAAGATVAVLTGTTAALYKSLEDGNLNNNPATSPAFWVADGTAFSAWDAAITYSADQRVSDLVGHRVYESLSGGTSAIATMTIASPCVVSWAAHGLPAGTPILFTTTGALPTGLTAGTVYYVLAPTADAFNLAATAGGAAITTSGTQSGVHTATANPNKGKDPTLAANAAFWLDAGPTNRWAMFDSLNGTRTSHPYKIDTTIQLTGRINSIALLNLVNPVAARVTISTLADGVVYDESFSLLSTGGINDWFAFFFEAIETKPTLLLTGLPLYADPTVQIIIEGDGTGDVECGHVSIGLSKKLGRTLHNGAQIGIIDYSRKTVDDFGNYSVIERAFSKRGSFNLRMPKSSVDSVHAILTEYRARPAVYSATEDYGATMIFGFFRDFQIEIDQPQESICSIQIEGLT